MKLSLDALKDKAGKVVTTELLGTINGGTENRCHKVAPTWWSGK
jgi:hypothetical protein